MDTDFYQNPDHPRSILLVTVDIFELNKKSNFFHICIPSNSVPFALKVIPKSATA